jgi:hypothetical protein
MSVTHAKKTVWFLLNTMLFIGVHLVVPAAAAAPATMTATCHEDPERAPAPLPKNHGPQNHDCCLMGHMHATAPAFTLIVPALTLSIQPAADEVCGEDNSAPEPFTNNDDSGPPGVLSLRI